MAKKAYLNWTTEQIADVIRRYSIDEESTESIGDSYGCHRTSINNLLQQHGVPARKTWSRTGCSVGLTKMTDAQATQLAHEYTVEGLPIEHLAKKYDVVPVTIRRKLVELGVEMRARGPARHAHAVEGHLNCIVCHEDKPLAAFHADPSNSSGHNAACKVCVRNRIREGAYGVSEAQYNEMLAAQGGGCAVCGAAADSERNRKGKVLNVDHCHRTNRVRGLLCHHCNVSAGLMADSVPMLEGLIKYLA